jgi:hypothetical protein
MSVHVPDETKIPQVKWYRNGSYDLTPKRFYEGRSYILDDEKQIWAHVASDTSKITIYKGDKLCKTISLIVEFGFNNSRVFRKQDKMYFCSREFLVVFDLDTLDHKVDYFREYPLPQFVSPEKQWRIDAEFTEILEIPLRL